MGSVLRLPIGATAAACAALLLSGCGGGGGSSTTTNPTLNLVGRVFNAATGEGVAGATVQLASVSATVRATASVPDRTTTTDASGTYRFNGLPTTITSGKVIVTRTGFESTEASVSTIASALWVSSIGLTPAGTPVTISPAAGGEVLQTVAEAPSLPRVELEIPPSALPGSGPTTVTVTPVVNQPSQSLVTAASVSSSAVGSISTGAPEVGARISPQGTVLSTPAQITLPLPFALPAGTSVPLLQFKNGNWVEVASATVNADGVSATGSISEFYPTGVAAWHDFQRTSSSLPGVTLPEVSLNSIQNDINNLPDRHFVINRVVEAGKIAEITARFRMQFEATALPTSPVNEEVLVLGLAGTRNALTDYFASGEWHITAGAVSFGVTEDTLTVRRIVGGQSIGNAGSFKVVRGKATWPIPPARSGHNQGGLG